MMIMTIMMTTTTRDRQPAKPLLTAKAVSDGLHRAEEVAEMSVDVVPIT